MGFCFFSALQTKTDVTVNEEVSYTLDSRIFQKKTCSRFLRLWPEDAELLLNLQGKKRLFFFVEYANCCQSECRIAVITGFPLMLTAFVHY